MAEPLCKYFGLCGGCTAQHIDYNIQLENKKNNLAHAIKYDSSKIKLFSGKPYHYRNRLDLLFHSKGLGLRQKGKKNNVVDIEQCAICNEKINQLISEIRNFFDNERLADYFDRFDSNKKIGALRYAVIRAPQNDSSISFVLNPNSAQLEKACCQIKEFAKISAAKNIIITYSDPEKDSKFVPQSVSQEFFAAKGSEMLSEKYLGKKFFYSVQGFFQNNSEMAEKMHEYCNNIMKSQESQTKSSHLLDIYAGVGTFGIINSGLFKTVTIIESFAKCIDAAQMNINENKVKNARAFALDAAKLRKISLQKPLFVITDPPRSGMDAKTILQLKELKPETIIYVSCNVKQLGRDLKKFKGYGIRSAALFDFFPHTNHCESIVELARKENPDENGWKRKVFG